MQTHHENTLCNICMSIGAFMVIYVAFDDTQVDELMISAFGGAIFFLALSIMPGPVPISIHIGFWSKHGYIEKTKIFDIICRIIGFLALTVALIRCTQAYLLA